MQAPTRRAALIPTLAATASLALLCAGNAAGTDPAAEPATGPAGDSDPPAGFETLDAAAVATAESLRAAALEDQRAWEFVEGLSVEVGPRLAGSDGDRRAVVWARQRLERWGFETVRTEPVTVPRWQRGDAVGRIVAPFPQPMVLAALGGSVGTPEGGLEAEVVALESMEALAAAERSAIAGKIVYLGGRMESTRDGRGYVAAVAKRVAGASLAAAKGAVALLIRSAGTSSSRIAHTGTMIYAEDAPRIPAAALANADADLLEAQLRRLGTGPDQVAGPLRFYLELGSRHLGEAESANVIAEVRGRERPEEIVVLAAHLDSWDLGTGAVDDGAGCAVVAAAARLIAGLERPPRRTVRVLLTANEEFGLSGARAYAERYAGEIARHVAGLESDLGAAAVWALRSRVEEPVLPVVRDLERLLAPLGIEYQGNEAFGGADLRFLREAGMPVFDLPQDARPYFHVHHTIDDTLDKVDPANLRQNVAAYAVAAYVLAEVDRDLGRAPAEEEEE